MVMVSLIEHVCIGGRVAAIIVRADFRPDGIQFVTPAEYSQQLGFMRRPAGYVIQPHVHMPVKHETMLTQEVLYLRSGRVRVDFYGDDEVFAESREIRSGDVILLSSSGHGFEMLEESELIEVKQGPYLDDKRRFTPRSR